MIKHCLFLGCILSLYIHTIEYKEVIHLHTCKEDLDISINRYQTVGFLKQLITKREGIIPNQQTITPIWWKWFFLKENGPIISDDTTIQTMIDTYHTYDFELILVPSKEEYGIIEPMEK